MYELDEQQQKKKRKKATRTENFSGYAVAPG